MGILNKARLTAIARSYRALFFQALEAGEDELATLAMTLFFEVNSTGASENYNWIGDIPVMEEWTGDRPHSGLRLEGYELENKEWATGLIMKANDIEDDRLGMLSPRINGLVRAYGIHVFEKALELIETGDALTCYDGKRFFATNHAEGSSGTQINLRTGGESALSSNTFRSYSAYMKELRNDKGKLLGIRPTHLWCGTTLSPTAREILEAERDAAGATNIDRNQAKVLEIPGLASATMWGLVDLSKPLKPFIKQNRRNVNVTSLTDPESPEFYNSRTVKFGVDYRGNYGVGMWQLMVRADGA